MKFSFILPHFRPSGVINRATEIANQLISKGHVVLFFTPDGMPCKWRESLQPHSYTELEKHIHEYVVIFSATQYKLYYKLYENKKCKKGIFYVLHDETLFNNGGIDPINAYTDTNLQYITSSKFIKDRLLDSYNIKSSIVYPGVNPNHFFNIYKTPKTITLLHKGTSNDTPWKGKAGFDEVCILLSIKGENLKSLSPTQEKIVYIYNATEFFISNSFFEGFNNCILEAMACGVPVICTNDGGSADYVIHKENAFVVPVGSPYGIKFAVNYLRQHPDMVDMLIKNGMETAKKFTWEQCCDNFLNIVENKQIEIPITITSKEDKKIEFTKTIDRKNVKGFLVDIIIPVYDALKDTKRCINSIIKNSGDIKYRIILINDCSNATTSDYLKDIAKKHNNIELVEHTTNLGYLKSINEGLLFYKTPYKICLNSDVIVTEDWLNKLITVVETNPQVGLVAPLTNFATSLTIIPPDGSNIIDVNDYITKHSKKLYPEACTVIGYCLLITQKVIDQIGVFDEVFDPGYYEECDYQFRAKEVGFKAVVCDNCYVYHKGKSSFKEQRTVLINKNRNIFHSKWEKEYRLAFSEYDKNNYLGYLRDKRSQKLIAQLTTSFDVVFLISMENSESILNIINIANEMLLKGVKVGIASVGNYESTTNSQIINPFVFTNINSLFDSNIKSKVYVATGYKTVDPAIVLAKKHNGKTVYFISDITDVAMGAEDYNSILDSYTKIKNKIVISTWLQNNLDNLGHKTTKIVMGVDLDVYYQTANKYDKFTVVGCSKSNIKDLNNIFSIVTKLNPNIQCNYFGEKTLDFNCLGNIDTNKKVIELSKSHICIDTSVLQGFSYIGLEAMACNCVFLTTNNTGVDDYCINGKNTLYSNVGDYATMAMNIIKLNNNTELYTTINKNATEKIKKFDLNMVVDNFIDYFNSL